MGDRDAREDCDCRFRVILCGKPFSLIEVGIDWRR
jgi:hypothetical protein